MSEPNDEEFAKMIAPAITCYAPPLDIEPKEQTPHWHLKRAYALLFKAGLSDPVLMEACAMIDDAHRLINGKDEPQPIRRGDVVQDTRDFKFATVETVHANGAITVWYHTGGMLLTDPGLWIKVGRAKFMPDGTPVED